jgi:trehalose 6-phosphate synthase
MGETLVPQTGAELGCFPIGIDVRAFADGALIASTKPEIARLRTSLHGSKLVIGVDRIDYSKGLEHRFRAFDRLLHSEPELKRQLSFLQIAVPSRGGIETYCRLQTELAALVSDINGRHGEIDWTPIRYLTKGYGQAMLAGLYRSAHVGLVTPLRDGMNLVAKEYVAAQDPANPGVLVLSEFAGAAKQLDSALLVNPHDVDDVARAVRRAARMPLDERIARWQPAMAALEQDDIHCWFADFVTALEQRTTRKLPVRRNADMDMPLSIVGPSEGGMTGELLSQ